MLGLPIERVRIELGDSDFPETPGSRGSWGAATAGSGLFDACLQRREALTAKLGIPVLDALFADGRVSGAGRGEMLGALAGTLGLEASGEIKPGSMSKAFSQPAYGAHFAEVAVDVDTREIRAQHARRVRGRPHPERKAGEEPDGGRDDLGRGLGPARRRDDRPETRLLRES